MHMHDSVQKHAVSCLIDMQFCSTS